MNQLNEENNVNDLINDINIDFFHDLLKEIHDVVMVEAVDNVKNSEVLVNAVKAGWPSEEGQVWLDNFNNLSNEVVTSLENCYGQVENDFNRLFTEWEAYKKANTVDKEDK